jgi:hypothetical protein
VQQTYTEWIDEEKVEEFNEFLDNQLQSKLGRGFNSAATSQRTSSATLVVAAASLSSVITCLLLYDSNRIRRLQ